MLDLSMIVNSAGAEETTLIHAEIANRFNDVNRFGEKLRIYPQSVQFDGKIPLIKKEDAEFIEHVDTEPLREECAHFLECMKTRNNPLTDAHSGIEVLRVLETCQNSIKKNGAPISL